MDPKEFVSEFDLAIKLWSSNNIIERIETADDEELFEFAETLALISRHHFIGNAEKENENFSFVANSSLSGGPHPCSFPDCRARRLDELASFASLYADVVYITNPFEDIITGKERPFNTMARLELISAVATYLQLKPLFELGLIKYAHSLLSFCSHHHATLAQPLQDSIWKKSNELRAILFEYLIDRVTIEFDIGDGAGPFLKIKGPESLIDHGVVFMHLTGPPSTHTKGLLKQDLPYKLSRNEIIDEGLLSMIIEPIVEDLSRQEWHTSFFGTSYLCNNKAQMGLASRINSSNFKANANVFQSTMDHYLPSIFSKDVATLTALRLREDEAFKVYRDKLRRLIGSSSDWSVEHLSEVVRDELVPEINLIDKRIRDWKSNLTSNLQEKLIFTTGAVSVGLYSGFLPPNLGQIVAAAGGGTALVGALMDYNKTFKTKEKAESSDFYFLWQANR